MKHLLLPVFLLFLSQLKSQELIVNGDFQNGNSGFTSELPFNGECAGSSYSIESTPFDKCLNFSKDLIGEYETDVFLVVDGGSVPYSVWENSELIELEKGNKYQFSFAAASFTPRSNYINRKPSFEVYLNDALILKVVAEEVLVDEWRTYSYDWVANEASSAQFKIVQSNASVGGGFDFVLDEVSLQILCKPIVSNQNNLVVNGDFQNGNSAFTSSLPFNSSCSPGSYAVESTPYDKCVVFSRDLTGQDECDLMMIVDGGPSLDPIWSQDVIVEEDKAYQFAFEASSFTPRSNYVNENPSFRVEVDGEMVLEVSSEEIKKDELTLFISRDWTAQNNGSVTLAIIQSNASNASGYDYVIDNISFKSICKSLSVIAENLVENGGFQNGTVGFTSDLPFNNSCNQSSRSIGAIPYDKCVNFSRELIGQDSCDLFLIVDGPTSPLVIWENTNTIVVEEGKNYYFSFDVASFTPRTNYFNVKPSFDVLIDGDVVFSVDQEEVLTDQWRTQKSTLWNASTTKEVQIQLVQSNGTFGLGYDYALDNIKFLKDVVLSTSPLSKFSYEMKVFPNPSSGSFTITLPKTKTQETKVDVLDQNGNKVYQATIDFNKTISLPSSLDMGLYYLKVVQDENIYLEKIMVE